MFSLLSLRPLFFCLSPLLASAVVSLSCHLAFLVTPSSFLNLSDCFFSSLPFTPHLLFFFSSTALSCLVLLFFPWFFSFVLPFPFLSFPNLCSNFYSSVLGFSPVTSPPDTCVYCICTKLLLNRILVVKPKATMCFILPAWKHFSSFSQFAFKHKQIFPDVLVSDDL